MADFWDFKFNDSPDFVETFDELPLWSASFGLLLLKHVALVSNQTVLDMGSGAGFPLLELAERLGSSCKCIGLDPWKNANDRAKKKIKNYEAHHVTVMEGSAEQIPLDNGSVDLIVSNLGVNNFENPDVVFTECYRVLKPGGRLALTTNINGHWKEFYRVFEETLRIQNRQELIDRLNQQQEHRGTVKSISKLFTDHGFRMTRVIEEPFIMRFLNGSAFLNHHFIKAGWLSSWQNIIPENEWPVIFKQLETDLNRQASQSGVLNLTVPMAFMEAEKIK